MLRGIIITNHIFHIKSISLDMFSYEFNMWLDIRNS